MEDILRPEPTFKAIDHHGDQINGSITENVTNVIDKTTTVDLSGVEFLFRSLIEAIAERPEPKVYAMPSEVIVKNELIQQAPPTVYVSVPEQKVEAHNKVIVMINPLWMLLGTAIPTLAIVADIIIRTYFEK